MKRTKLLTAAMAAAFLAAGSASLAQDQGSYDTHHPAQGGEAQPGAEAPQPPMQGDQPGMMGMMRMMDMAQMMQMMNMMGGGAASQAGMGMDRMDPAGMAMTNRVEGRIAFLRAELKITDAQADPWEAFAGALRDNARRLDEARKAYHGVASAQTLGQRLAAQEQWLSARLDGIRAIKAAFERFYAALSPDQQKTADELLAMHMGLMPAGMRPVGMMPMGMMPMGMMPMGGSSQ